MKHYDTHGDNVISLKIENAKLLNLSEQEYRPMEALNQSYIKDIHNVSPSYAEYRLKNPEVGPALLFGSALHHYVLEQSTFYGYYAVAPSCDRRTKLGKETWESFVADNGDKTVLKDSDKDALKLIIDLEERHKRGLELKANIERGIANVEKFINEKSKPKSEGESEKS